MNSRTIVAIVLLSLAASVYLVLAFQEEVPVRMVSEVVDDPYGNSGQESILIGLPVIEGGSADPKTTTETNYVWTQHLDQFRSKVEITVSITENGSNWVVRNETTVLSGYPYPPFVTYHNFTLDNSHLVLQIRAFEDHNNDHPIWAVYDGKLRDQIDERPVQLTGKANFVEKSGGYYWDTTVVTIGCSSKFIPDDLREQYDADGDGRATDPL